MLLKQKVGEGEGEWVRLPRMLYNIFLPQFSRIRQLPGVGLRKARGKLTRVTIHSFNTIVVYSGKGRFQQVFFSDLCTAWNPRCWSVWRALPPRPPCGGSCSTAAWWCTSLTTLRPSCSTSSGGCVGWASRSSSFVGLGQVGYEIQYAPWRMMCLSQVPKLVA